LVIFNCLELNLYNNDGLVFYDGEALPKEEHAWYLLALSGSAVVVLLITVAITFFMWIHRAYSNLPFLGNLNPKTTPGWAVGWWFIPVALLFKPFGVMKEIYIWSGADGAKISTNILGLWWTVWICSRFLSILTSRLPSTNLEEYSVIVGIGVIGYMVEIFAGILFLKIVASITYSQEIKSEIKSRNI